MYVAPVGVIRLGYILVTTTTESYRGGFDRYPNVYVINPLDFITTTTTTLYYDTGLDFESQY